MHDVKCFKMKITSPSHTWWFVKPPFVHETVALCRRSGLCGIRQPSLWWLFTQAHSDRTLPLFIPRQHIEKPSGKLDTHIQQTYRNTKYPTVQYTAAYMVCLRKKKDNNIYSSNNWTTRPLTHIGNILYTDFFQKKHNCTEYDLSYWLVSQILH